jgi:hypothetical protein
MPAPRPGRRHHWGGHHRHVYWTEALIVSKIQEWTERYGEPPTFLDWHPASARRRGQQERIDRFYAGDWPVSKTVATRFGSFRAGILAAGLPPSSFANRPGPSVPIEVIRERVAHLKRPLAAAPQLAVHLKAVIEAQRSGEVQALAAALDDLALTAASYAENLRHHRMAA